MNNKNKESATSMCGNTKHNRNRNYKIISKNHNGNNSNNDN